MKKNFLRRLFSLDPYGALGTELLLAADAKADISERALWLARLLGWIRSGGEEARTARLRYLLLHLEKNPELKKKVGAALRSLARDSSPLRLLVQTGFALESGLWTELGHRLLSRVLPTLVENDLLEIFTKAGWEEADALWLESLSDDLLASVAALFRLEPEEADFTPFLNATREALLLLATSANHFGLSREVRKRHAMGTVDKSPFLQVHALVVKWAVHAGDLPGKEEDLQEWNAALGLCRQVLRAVYQNMEGAGVSVGLVYRLEVIAATLQRLDDILLFLTAPEKPRALVSLAGKVLRSAEDRGSIREHLRTHLYLLSRHIVERNGQSGEHYLAQTTPEFLSLFYSALGGGIIVVFMTVGKILVHHMHMPPLPTAVADWIVYSAGFLAMQFTGLTLATKIPSFLAAHLARQLTGMEHRARAAEISRDIRLSVVSQAVAFLGNMFAVIPFGLLFVHLLSLIGLPLFSPEEGRAAVAEVHLLKSLAIPLGALTGVELWLSSLAGGWFENWLVFQRVPEAIRSHPALKRVLGERRAAGLADMIFTRSSGVAANLALGFLFGFVPLLGVFIGVKTESRHVTIASASTLLGLHALEPGAITGSMITFTVLGLVAIGIMNFLVRFFLALSVAANATGVRRARLHRFFNPFRRRAKA